MAQNKDFPPILHTTFFPDIELTGAKEGFTAISSKDGKGLANYNNYGRFILQTTSPVIILNAGGDGPRVVEYSEYRKNPDKYPHAKRTKFGVLGTIRMNDADHGHEITMFFGTDAKNTARLGFFAEKFTDLLENLGFDEETIKEQVFEIGKEAARSVAGRWYIKHLGTVSDMNLLKDPAKVSEERKAQKLATQAPAPAAPQVQNFVLNADETYLIEQLEQLGKTGKIKETTREKIAITLQAGYGSGASRKATSQARAAYIAANAEQYFKNLAIKDN